MKDTDGDIFDYTERVVFHFTIHPGIRALWSSKGLPWDVDDLYNELEEAISDDTNKEYWSWIEWTQKEMIEEMNKTRK